MKTFKFARINNTPQIVVELSMVLDDTFYPLLSMLDILDDTFYPLLSKLDAIYNSPFSWATTKATFSLLITV